MTLDPPTADLPALKHAAKPSLFARSASDASTVGLGGLLSAGSKAIDRLPHGPEDHLRYLHMKLHTADLASQRARWVGGRLYNIVLGDDPAYVQMSARHLAQTLALLDLKAPDPVKIGEDYLLRTDIARQAYDGLRVQLGVADQT